MSLQELFQAMNMFKDGMKELGTARAISSAQEQVEQLKTQQMDKMQERAALSSISQGLTMSLAKIGAPVSQVQMAAGAIAPAPITNSNEAYYQGAAAGPVQGKSLMDLAKSGQQFENQPKFQLQQMENDAKIEASRLQGASAAGRTASKENKDLDKRFVDFGKALNPTGPRAGEYGKLRNQLHQIGRVDTLFQDGFNMRGPQAEEVALGLHRLLSGSNAAHVEQVKALLPKSAMSSAQALKSYFTNNPELLNNEKWMKNLKKTVDREKITIERQAKEAGYANAATNADLIDVDPERFDTMLKSQGLSLKEYKSFLDNAGKIPEPTPGMFKFPDGTTGRGLKHPDGRIQKLPDQASASFYQGNQPASTGGVIQRPGEMIDPYTDRMIDNESDRKEYLRKVTYTKKA
jgi:hypothetical protein